MEWISVKDRLPEFEKSVLLFDKWQTSTAPFEIREDVRTGYLIEVVTRKTSDGIVNYPEWGGTEFAFNITHWMPLPEPPKSNG